MSGTISADRRYVFAIHGASNWYRARQRRREERRRQVYRAAPGQQPHLEQIIDPENLLLVYNKLKTEGGKAPGIDGLRYGDVTVSEIGRALRLAAEAIRQRRYRPYPTRSVLIPKHNGRYRELRLATIVDRVVAKSLHEALTPLLDPVFLPGVYGFRPGCSVWDMLLAIEQTAISQDRLVLAVDDVRDAFPSVRIADALADYRRHIGDEGVLWLIETVLRGHEGQAHTTGIDQGSALAPGTFNLRTHYCLDLPQSQPDAAGPGNPPWGRWADNLVYLARGVYEGQSALQRARQLLQAAGLTLKGEDGPPVNLKHQGARVEILGFRVGYRNGRLWYGMGESAWRDLETALERSHRAPNPAQAAEAALRGWVAAMGPAFESVEEREALQEVRRAAARRGFREMGTKAALLGWLREARQRWQAAREGALGASECAWVSPTASATRSARQDRPPVVSAGEAGCPGDSSPGSPAPLFARSQDGDR